MGATEIRKRVFNSLTGKYYEILQRPAIPDGETQRIYNPVTGRYYEIRQHSSKYTGPGQIKGLWSSKKSTNVSSVRK